MNISSEHTGSSLPLTSPALGQELSRVSHNLMGSISALMMCEHMLGKDVAASEELSANPHIVTAMALLKETADQIRDYGDHFMALSRRYHQIHPAQGNGKSA